MDGVAFVMLFIFLILSSAFIAFILYRRKKKRGACVIINPI